MVFAPSLPHAATVTFSETSAAESHLCPGLLAASPRALSLPRTSRWASRHLLSHDPSTVSCSASPGFASLPSYTGTLPTLLPEADLGHGLPSVWPPIAPAREPKLDSTIWSAAPGLPPPTACPLGNAHCWAAVHGALRPPNTPPIPSLLPRVVILSPYTMFTLQKLPCETCSQ